MLEVSNIHLGFRGVRALNGVSLRAEEGETLGVIGPNGSGKSTLFNVITGIYRPDRGQVSFRGQPIAGRDPRVIAERGLARTYQNKRLFGSLTVLENVLVPALRQQKGGWIGDMAGLPAARAGRDAGRALALQCLDFVGLTPLSDTLAGSLAYGQQNRLELARALALEPRLLLLDEPAAGLNPGERGEMQALIGRIRDRGVTVVLVEHDMRVVMQLCSRIVVLDHGEGIANGTHAQVTADPAVIAAYFGTPAEQANG